MVNIVFPGDTRGIPEVGIVVFPDVDRVASLGIGPEIVAFPAGDITDPRRAAEVEMEALTETIVDANIVARDRLGREGIAPEGRGLKCLTEGRGICLIGEKVVSYGRNSPQSVRSLRERSWERQERLAYGEPREDSPVAIHMTQPSVRFTLGHSPYPDRGYYDIPEQYVREIKTRPL